MLWIVLVTMLLLSAAAAAKSRRTISRRMDQVEADCQADLRNPSGPPRFNG